MTSYPILSFLLLSSIALVVSAQEEYSPDYRPWARYQPPVEPEPEYQPPARPEPRRYPQPPRQPESRYPEPPRQPEPRYEYTQPTEVERAPAVVVPTRSCDNVKCDRGESCVNGECQCRDSCVGSYNRGRQICVDGITYQHECYFWRNLCYCRKNDPRCGGDDFRRHQVYDILSINYYSECRDMDALCDWRSESNSFTYRLIAWLQHALRRKLTYPILTDEESIFRPVANRYRHSNQWYTTRNYNHVVSFWFCELDRSNKGSLEHRDLNRLYQVLLPNNPCTQVFFKQCFSQLSTIGLSHWNRCFGIGEDEVKSCSEVGV